MALLFFFPFTLDTFSFSEEKNLENLWSFQEIFFLEVALTFWGIFFFEFPFFLLLWFSVEKKIQNLPKFWKWLSFFAFVLSGIITPTLDASLQSVIALLGICFYLISIIFLQKRIRLKFSGFSLLY